MKSFVCECGRKRIVKDNIKLIICFSCGNKMKQIELNEKLNNSNKLYKCLNSTKLLN